MPFIIEVSSGGVPVGVYRARFVRVENYTNEERPDLPPGLRWIWVIVGGPLDGSETSRITSKKFGPKAAQPKLLRMITGREVQPGEKIDIETLYGTEGTIVVEESQGGGIRVGSFMRDAAPIQAPAPPAQAPAPPAQAPAVPATGDVSEVF